VFCLTLSNLQYWLIDIGLKDEFQVADIYYIQFELLIVPFFYVFVKSYLLKSIRIKLIIFILTPFVLGMIYQVITNTIRLDPLLLKRLNFFVEFATILYNLTLISLLIRDIYITEKRQKHYNTEKVNINTRWLKHILIVGFLICLIWSVATQAFHTNSSNGLSIYYPLWISISSLIYWMGHKGLIEIQLISERLSIRKQRTSTTSRIKPRFSSNTKGELLFKEIALYIYSEKIFLNPNISQQLIANKFNISSGYLSKLTNQNSEFNFNDYINHLRIKAAKDMLLNEEFNQYTIHAIGLESGFKTKSNFYSAFKKFTKMTPSMYKKQKNVS